MGVSGYKTKTLFYKYIILLFGEYAESEAGAAVYVMFWIFEIGDYIMREFGI